MRRPYARNLGKKARDKELWMKMGKACRGRRGDYIDTLDLGFKI